MMFYFCILCFSKQYAWNFFGLLFYSCPVNNCYQKLQKTHWLSLCMPMPIDIKNVEFLRPQKLRKYLVDDAVHC